jgi:hypothetical protein
MTWRAVYLQGRILRRALRAPGGPGVHGAHHGPGGGSRRARGRAVQVDPIKPTLKAPGTEHVKLKCDILLSTFGSNINLRRYTVVVTEGVLASSVSNAVVAGYAAQARAYTRPLFGST